MPANHFAIQTCLIDYLRQHVPDLVLVGGVSSLAAADAAPGPSPSVYVIYDGERIVDTRHDCARQVVGQRWLVVLYVRHAAQDGGAALRDRAGLLFSALIAALAAWTPPGETRPITRINAPRPSYTSVAGWFPLAYEARLVI